MKTRPSALNLKLWLRETKKHTVQTSLDTVFMCIIFVLSKKKKKKKLFVDLLVKKMNDLEKWADEDELEINNEKKELKVELGEFFLRVSFLALLPFYSWTDSLGWSANQSTVSHHQTSPHILHTETDHHVLARAWQLTSDLVSGS